MCGAAAAAAGNGGCGCCMGLDNVLAVVVVVVGRLLYIRYCQCGLGVIVVQG